MVAVHQQVAIYSHHFPSKLQVTVEENQIFWNSLTNTKGSAWQGTAQSKTTIFLSPLYSFIYMITVPAGSPSPGGDVTVYVKDINQSSVPTPLYSVLVSTSVFMALSTVFHSINSRNNSPFSHSVLPVLSLPYWSFQLYTSL